MNDSPKHNSFTQFMIGTLSFATHSNKTNHCSLTSTVKDSGPYNFSSYASMKLCVAKGYIPSCIAWNGEYLNLKIVNQCLHLNYKFHLRKQFRLDFDLTAAIKDLSPCNFSSYALLRGLFPSCSARNAEYLNLKIINKWLHLNYKFHLRKQFGVDFGLSSNYQRFKPLQIQ